MDPVLLVRNLTLSLGTAGHLEAVSLRVDPGEMLALVGPSGCGKTSLLRAVARLAEPESGETLLEGKPPEAWGWPAYRRKTVYAEQRPHMSPGTVGEVLARPFRFHTAGGAPFPGEEARALLGRVGLDGRWGDEADRLSEGERQRVSLVRALLLNPPVLLLDEPTSALDEATETAVEALVRERVAGCGGGAVVVTHKPEQARRWCDRVFDLSAHLRRAAATAGAGS
jgi:putative ABC transport system ATP-binding protein